MENKKSFKGKFLKQIKNTDGNLSFNKYLLLIFKIPVYIVSNIIASLAGEFPNRRKGI
jgi:hypothetical protein